MCIRDRAGTLKVVGTRTEQVYCEIERLLTDKEEYSRMSHATNPYGDGYASKRIVEIIKEYLKGK